MKKVLATLAALLALSGAMSCAPPAPRGEVSELKIPLGAGGFGFLPLYVMQKYKLIEKQAAAEGVQVTVSWPNIGGPAVMNDALLSGSVHFITAGPPAFLTLWDRTRDNVGVKGVAAMSSMPMVLNARTSQLKALDDISGDARMGVTAIKVSIPSIIMQMHAAKKFGPDQTFRFDPFTVTLAHPDALISLTSGSGNIVAHWASPPFSQRELRDPAIKTLMNSDDIMGGSTTFTMISTTTKFQQENPKVYAAVVRALKEAEDLIASDKPAAAAILLEAMGGSGWTVDELVAVLNDPSTKYTMQPENVLTYANFMHQIGSIKNAPAGMSDIFFETPEVAGEPEVTAQITQPQGAASDLGKPAPLLTVDGVTLQYRTREHLVTATYRVSFSVRQSDRYVILGPSGCGKSTLLKAVGGYIRPVEGTIRLRGNAITRPGPDRVLVFQEFDQLLPWKTVRENVIFALTASKRLRGAEARDRANHYIDKVRLTTFADSYPHTLSGGMKQRVAIARGMAMEPEILLMDEPFAALDALTRAKMQEELLQLWEETRATILFVTHSIPEAVRVGNRILLLTPHPGRVRAELGSTGIDTTDADGRLLSARIEHLLFADEAGEASCPMPETSPTADDRRDFVNDAPPSGFGVIEKPLTLLEKIFDRGDVRKGLVLVVLALVWEGYGRWLNNPLLFPTFSSTATAFINSTMNGQLTTATLRSLVTLMQGYVIGLALAALATAFAAATRFGADVLDTLTSMFNPLPSIALLPLAMIWFGLGEGSILFVLVHSVLWPVALNTHAGFHSVSTTWRMVGQNYGLSRTAYVTRILIPGALPSIVTGLKIGWAFAWRALIAAELVFGASSSGGGLGWFIFENKNLLEVSNVFAGLLMVILFGLLVENVVFRTLEQRTIRRWGMQS